MNTYMVIFLTLFASMIASLSQVMFKKAITPNISLRGIIRLVTNKMVLIGGIGYIASLVIYLYALYNAPLSIVYPVFASVFIFIVVFSKLMLKEQINNLRYMGIAVIFIGIVIISVTI